MPSHACSMRACDCVISLSGRVAVEKYDCTAVVLATQLRPDSVTVTLVVKENNKKNVTTVMGINE